MALIVEDGTGKSDSESYISVADADTRHSNAGLTNWATLSTTEKEQAIRRATQYMEQAFRLRWKGQRKERLQALSWPRYDVVVDCWSVDSDTVPSEIANACADLALKAAAGDLAPDLERGIKREKVGPIETEFDTATPQSKRYRAIEMTLAPFLKGSLMSASLVRA